MQYLTEHWFQMALCPAGSHVGRASPNHLSVLEAPFPVGWLGSAYCAMSEQQRALGLLKLSKWLKHAAVKGLPQKYTASDENRILFICSQAVIQGNQT